MAQRRLIFAPPWPTQEEQQPQVPQTAEAHAAGRLTSEASSASAEPGVPLEPWSWLVPLLQRLGCPVLDRRFACCAAVTRAEAATAADAEPEVVLHKLRLCAEAGIGQLQVKAPHFLLDVSQTLSLLRLGNF